MALIHISPHCYRPLPETHRDGGTNFELQSFKLQTVIIFIFIIISDIHDIGKELI